MADRDYKHVVQDVTNIYIGGKLSYGEMLDLDEIPFKFKVILSHYILKEVSRETTIENASGNLSEVNLDGDSFKSYLQIGPFDALTRRIASINQAEIQQVDLSAFLPLFKAMGFKTLGDIEKLVKDYSEAAYQIACFQIGLTDLDILSSSVAPQDLCTAFILKNGGGRVGLKFMLDTLNGPSDMNESMADFLLDQTKDLPFMNK